jgi:hypothetical protein
MKWKRERDLLVAQTLAFVQSVAGKKGDAKADDGIADTRIEDAIPDIEAALFEAIKPAAPPDTSRLIESVPAPAHLRVVSAPVSRGIVPSEVRAEMQARVANFRAHQERFNKDRDQYYSATFAKLRAAIGTDVAPAPPRK